MDRRKSARWHTVYSVISTLIEEAAIAVGLLWLLPLFNITVPVWGIILILVGFAVFSYIMYLIGHPTISYREVSAPESIVGRVGVVERPLEPDGYVKVSGELWRATCLDSPLKEGDEIIVVGIDGLKLTVSKRSARTWEG